MDMQNPFPGMNPYMESPSRWRDTHNSLIVYLRAALNAALPEGFAANIEESVYIAPSHPIDKLSAEEAIPWIAVIGPEPGGIVTAIEVLSPTNKEKGPGRDKYLRKRRRFINTSVNVLEIDLLRTGPYTLAAPEARLREKHPRWDYICCLYSTQEPDVFETWPRTVREPLPKVAVPLLPPHDDLSLDLQAALNRAYEEGGFARSLDYRAVPPSPSFSAEDAAWLDTLLKEKGLR